ncbi:unnamed protein product [Albugo candida]|uniref:Uncharacterized protein n=1 Tax=Albugo candida TaxID=65357 RepID=A0A024GRU0_9STRA|nr:unnamed protein product [Albugo candida]|eukprot:CCI49080.1 unnamed protein product [Albugo candida]
MGLSMSKEVRIKKCYEATRRAPSKLLAIVEEGGTCDYQNMLVIQLSYASNLCTLQGHLISSPNLTLYLHHVLHPRDCNKSRKAYEQGTFVLKLEDMHFVIRVEIMIATWVVNVVGHHEIESYPTSYRKSHSISRHHQ